MKNVGGTEVISRTLEVLFVAGLLPSNLLHCNSRSGWRELSMTRIEKTPTAELSLAAVYVICIFLTAISMS